MLYLVGSSVFGTHQDMLKIGFTDSWKKRSPSYESNNKGFDLLGMREGDKALETIFHTLYHDHVCIRPNHINSDEWFWYQKEIVKVFNEYSDDEVYDLASSNREKFIETMDYELFRSPGETTRRKILYRLYEPGRIKRYKLKYEKRWGEVRPTMDYHFYKELVYWKLSERWPDVKSLDEISNLYLEILCDYFNSLKEYVQDVCFQNIFYSEDFPTPLWSVHYDMSRQEKTLIRDLVNNLGPDRIKELGHNYELCKKEFEEEYRKKQ